MPGARTGIGSCSPALQRRLAKSDGNTQTKLREVMMKFIFKDAVIRFAKDGVEISTDQYSQLWMEGTMAERMDSGQWGMNELTEYLIERDLLDSFMEELNKAKQEAA
jgi:hypothetical protein